MVTLESKFSSGARLEIEGSFDLSAAAAVLNITAPDGSTKTCRGQNLSVAKNGTGAYDVTWKCASVLDGSPVFQCVELVNGRADLIANAVATALSARIKAAPTTDANGNLLFTVLTVGSTGAAADTTGAVTVGFSIVINTARMDGVI